MKNTKKIAIVCDWIKDWWGAEVVLEQLLEAFPTADIFTSIFFQKNNPLFDGRNITTSFIQKIPFINRSHKMALFLRPQAFESFDFSKYDVVISSTSAESKWIITKPDCLHVCYCHTPTRYFWSHYHEYLTMMEFGILNPLAQWIMPKMIHSLRQWDFIAAQRPDYFIANSKNTASRILKYYGRESEVLYPCLDVESIPFSSEKENYYLYAGRCIPYKKFDLLVETFNKNWKLLKIVSNTKNALAKKLEKISENNIEWIYETDNKKINILHSQARAFIFPPEEDFGLVPIAAQATWTPVIAYGKGWALETVINYKTWLFFEEQTEQSLNRAIEKFEQLDFNHADIREHALCFDKKIFIKNIKNIINYS